LSKGVDMSLSSPLSVLKEEAIVSLNVGRPLYEQEHALK